MTIHGHLWPFMNTCDHLWTPVTQNQQHPTKNCKTHQGFLIIKRYSGVIIGVGKVGESPTLGKFGGNFGKKGEMMKKGRKREKKGGEREKGGKGKERHGKRENGKWRGKKREKCKRGGENLKWKEKGMIAHLVTPLKRYQICGKDYRWLAGTWKCFRTTDVDV